MLFSTLPDKNKALMSQFSGYNPNPQATSQYKRSGNLFAENNQHSTDTRASKDAQELHLSKRTNENPKKLFQKSYSQDINDFFKDFKQKKLDFAPQSLFVANSTPYKENINNAIQEEPVNSGGMDIEVSEFFINTPSKSAETQQNSLFFPPKSSGEISQFTNNSSNSSYAMNTHETSAQKSTEQNDGFSRPNEKCCNSLIQMWKKDDPFFKGKYSTGATPKIRKEPFSQPFLSHLHLTRANSDIPPTLENSMSIVESRDQGLGNNKFADNAKKSAGMAATVRKSYPVSKNLFANQKNIENYKPKYAGESTKSLIQLSNRKSSASKTGGLFEGLGRNLFAAPDDRDLFRIPEKHNEMETEVANRSSYDEPGNRSDRNSSRILDEEYCEPQSRVSAKLNFDDALVNEESDGRGCSTPSKKRNLSDSEESSNYLSTLSVKKNYKNDGRMETMHNSSEATTDFSSQSSLDFGSFGKNHQLQKKEQQTSFSRFNEDFEKKEVLGSGFFGTVYRCLNRIDELEYAVKSIKYKKKGVSNMSQAVNEVQALASLSALDENPFIVRYYNVWVEDDLLYLVMEYCPSNLKNIEQLDIKFSESMIRRVLRDICQGLRHLHKQKIVHLDIKPENILFSRTSKYKIADLGLSRIAERRAGEDINEGDSRYLAPELLNDSTDDLPDLTKADIFSLGVTIYELMIRQEMPKNGPEWHAIRSNLLPKLDNLKNYSNSLKAIIKLMMSPNQDQRPSAHELISNYLQSEPELELKWEKTENKILKKRLADLEGKLKIQRKKSF